MAGKPGKTKRTMTVIWSLVIAIALIVFTTSVMLPSTKRARIDFRNDPKMSRTLPLTQPATVPAHFFGSKSGVFDLDPTTLPTTTDSRPRISSSKSLVFDLDPTTQPDNP